MLGCIGTRSNTIIEDLIPENPKIEATLGCLNSKANRARQLANEQQLEESSSP